MDLQSNFNTKRRGYRKIAAATTDARAAALSTFVDVEVFLDQAFLPGDGWQQIDAGDSTKVPARKAILGVLVAKKLIAPPPTP